MNRNNGQWESEGQGWPSGRGNGANRDERGETERRYGQGGSSGSTGDHELHADPWDREHRGERDPRRGRRTEWEENPWSRESQGERHGGNRQGYGGEASVAGGSRYGGEGPVYGGYGNVRSGQRYPQGEGQHSGSQNYGAQSYGSQGYGGSTHTGAAYGGGNATARLGSPYDETTRGWTEPYGSGIGSSSRSYGQSSPRSYGQFAGRGPKGYQRSDERIREDACERLTYDSEVDASDVTVTVADGEVTLEGEVENRNQKRRAEDVIENVNGVKDVHNRLRARRGLLASVMDEVTGRDHDENNIGRGPKNAPSPH